MQSHVIGYRDRVGAEKKGPIHYIPSASWPSRCQSQEWHYPNPNVFKVIGRLQTYEVKLHAVATTRSPVCMPNSIPSEEKVSAELEKLEKQGIIEKVGLAIGRHSQEEWGCTLACRYVDANPSYSERKTFWWLSRCPKWSKDVLNFTFRLPSVVAISRKQVHHHFCNTQRPQILQEVEFWHQLSQCTCH